VTAGFRRDIEENCAILEYYTALSGSFVPTFWGNLSIFKGEEVQEIEELDYMTLDDGTDRLSRNVSAELPLHAA
jgi:hypothetical protein